MKKIDLIKLNLKYIWKTWTKYIGTLASAFSIFFLFCTWEDIKITSMFYKSIIMILFCVIALILSIVWTCFIKKSNTIWKSATGKIKICYSDIIRDGFSKRNKEEKLLVIPVNSCFDTIVDEDISSCSKPLVSPNSLHGKWIGSMIKNEFTLDKIDEMIDNNLQKQNIKPCRVISVEEKKRGKINEYDLGTVALVRGNNKCTFLLLAVAKFDENNIAHTSIDEFEKCIKSLIFFYDNKCQGHKIMVPLMGTNLSRAGLSHDDSLRTIASLFQLYGDKIHGEVDIIIYNGDKDKVTLNIY